MLILFYFFTILKIVCTNDCTHNEVFYDESCFKLVKLRPLSLQPHQECLNITSSQCINYLEKVILRLNKIYINNLRLDKDYQFGFLDYKMNKKLWLKLISNYSNKSKSFNIFLNYYFFNNNFYIENQPNDDEHPNVMMHGSSSGIKCISGQKIYNSNESFSFYYDDCEKELPFICVKPYDTNLYIEDYDINDRCSTYDKIEPGGNWFECDKLRDAFNDSTIKLSKSHKCCMYNIKWRENFNDANKLCYKFDSVVFSLRLKGYKLVLEKYADFLVGNYKDTQSYLQDKDFFSFWTSCNSRILDPDALDRTNTKFECVQEQNDLTNELTSSVLENKDIRGIKISALNIKSNQLIKNYYNLTFLNLFLNKLKTNSLDDLKIELCNNQVYVTFPNETLNYNKSLHLSTCLLDILNTFDLNAIFLARRQSVTYSIQTQTIYSVKNEFNDLQCFHYSEKNAKIYLSIPILNICYHFTIFKLQNQNTSSINYYRNLNYSLEPNYDIELIDLNQEINSIILNTIGIADFISCNESSFLNNSMYLTKYLCYNLISLIKFTNKNDNYLFNLANHLIDSKLVFVLHSYSFIKTILKLSCNDKAFDLIDLIKKCSKFNADKSCLIKCPRECANSNNVWQYKLNPLAYLNQSSICSAALHSNSLNELFETNLYWFTSKTRRLKSDFVIKQNNIYSNIWPPVYLVNSFFDKINQFSGFYFKNAITLNENKKLDSNEILVLIKAVYYLNETETIRPLVYYSEKIESIHIRQLISSNRIDYHLTRNEPNILSLELKTTVLNDYFELIISNNSVKFPINVINTTQIQNENTIRLFNLEKSIKILKISTKTNSKLKCNWYFNNLNSGLNCQTDLSFNLNTSNLEIRDIHNEINIIYPSFEFKTFTRIILNSNNLNEKCKNGGVLSATSNKCVCLPGFGGINCENICNKTYFGTKCDHMCPNNECKGYLICNQDPIGCSCASGYKGYKCDEMCDPNRWGPNCLFECEKSCHNNCNMHTGKCNECNNGFYGLNCEKKCGLNCKKCNQLNGTCILFKSEIQSEECSFDHIVPCSIETNHFKIKELKLNILPGTSIICFLRLGNDSSKCESDFKELCYSSLNFHYRNTIAESKQHFNSCADIDKISNKNTDSLKKICNQLIRKEKNETWIGYLMNDFDCNKCSNVNKCEQNQELNDSFNEKSFKIIIMWLITFVIILLISLISKILNRIDDNYELLENFSF